MEFIRCVEARLDELNLRPSSAEQRFDLPPDTLRNLLRAAKNKDRVNAGPTLSKLQQICDALDLELYFGPRRQPLDAPTIDPINDPDYALVSTYPIAASAGPGATVEDASPDGALAFRKDWLSRKGISLDNAALLRARGYSMHPVISDGDLLMLDLSRNALSDVRLRADSSTRTTRNYDRSIFVVDLDGSLLVKGLVRVGENRMHLISENAIDYPFIELRGAEMNQLRIIGRVVWWGHSAE